jgi:hypothetical protein
MEPLIVSMKRKRRRRKRRTQAAKRRTQAAKRRNRRTPVVKTKRRAVVRMERRAVVRMNRRTVIVRMKRGEMQMILPRTMLILTTCSWAPPAKGRRRLCQGRGRLKPLEAPSSIVDVFR